MAVDRGLRVGVHVVEQREPLDQRVQIRGDRLAEQGQCRVTITSGVVAQHLVVGPVLADDVEDVLDRPARPDRSIGGRGASVGGNHLAIADGGELADPLVARVAQHSGGAIDDRGQVLVQEAVVAGVRAGAPRVGPNAESAGGDPDQLASLGRGRGHCRIGPGWDAADHLERRRLPAARLCLAPVPAGGMGDTALAGLAAGLPLREREDRHGVLTGVRREQVAAVGSHAQVGGRGPDSLRALD
jgi:hypothetical protein